MSPSQQAKFIMGLPRYIAQLGSTARITHRVLQVVRAVRDWQAAGLLFAASQTRLETEGVRGHQTRLDPGREYAPRSRWQHRCLRTQEMPTKRRQRERTHGARLRVTWHEAAEEDIAHWTARREHGARTCICTPTATQQRAMTSRFDAILPFDNAALAR